jgi:hypothetical protein
MWEVIMANNNPKPSKIVVNRSAATGQFVTPQYAKTHPKTTETEVYRPKPKGK